MRIYNFIHIPKNAGTSIKNYCQRHRKLRYYGHSNTTKNIKNTIIVLRQPEDRWISAINYIIRRDRELGRTYDQKYNYDYIASKLMINRRHPEVYHMLKPRRLQKIGSETLRLRWVLQPQKKWFYRPNNILLFNNLNQEWEFFCNKFSIGNGKLPNLNTTRKVENKTFSEQARQFISEMYEEDFKLWNYWSKLPLDQRIGINWSNHENSCNRP